MGWTEIRENARKRNEKIEAGWAEKRQLSPTQAYVSRNADRELASLGPVHLYPNCIVLAKRVGFFGSKDLQITEGIAEVAGAEARLITDGNVITRGDLARSILSSGWQRTEDRRLFFLQIDGPSFQWVVPLDGPEMAAAARIFATHITTAGRVST